MTSIWLLIFFLVILVVGGLIFAFIITRSPRSKSLNQDAYRSEWLKISQAVSRDNESSLHLAILNADKLLDKALRERGYKGQTMGERMKAAQTDWSNANHVWTAHKLRNRIAHETDIRLTHDIVSRALAAFKQGLKDIGAI